MLRHRNDVNPLVKGFPDADTRHDAAVGIDRVRMKFAHQGLVPLDIGDPDFPDVVVCKGRRRKAAGQCTDENCRFFMIRLILVNGSLSCRKISPDVGVGADVSIDDILVLEVASVDVEVGLRRRPLHAGGGALASQPLGERDK